MSYDLIHTTGEETSGSASEPESPNEIRVLIVEDQSLLTHFVQLTCEEIPGFIVVAQATTGQQALTVLTSTAIDLVILDIALPDFDGLTAIQLARKVGYDRFRALVVSSCTTPRAIHRVAETGCHGFTCKGVHPDELKRAIRAVGTGGTYFCDVFEAGRHALLSDPKSFTKVLSDHEITILDYIAANFSDRDIGAIMGIAESTANTHRTNIAGSLGVPIRVLPRYAASIGFGGPGSAVAASVVAMPLV